MSQTLKNVVDSILNILTKFGLTDDSRYSSTWMEYKIYQVRAELIIAEYNATGILNQDWMSDIGLLTFYKVTRADNNSVSCECDISKTTIPQTIALKTRDGNTDLGIFSLSSACGKYQYYPRPMYRWQNTPPEHTNSLFNWYYRINTELYVSNNPTTLRMIGLLLNPLEGKIMNSAPVASGSIVSGTVYLVKYNQIIYDGVVYAPDETFTGTLATTYGGSGIVYLNAQVQSYKDTDPFPAPGDMIRKIELEILTKEFAIEAQAVIDIRNDGVDDAAK
jgi:hypothetical protein